MTNHRTLRAAQAPGELDELDEMLAELELGGAPAAPAAPAALDPEVDEFLNPPPAGDEPPPPQGRQAAQTAPAASAAPAAPAAPDNSAITQLAQTLLAREQRAQQAAEEDAARQRRADAERVDPVYDPGTLNLTPEEEAQYAASRPVIEKLVRAELNRYHATSQPQFARTLGELREQIEQVRPAVAASSDVAFTAALRAGVPDLDARVRSPEWQDYLAQAVPYRGGVTFGQLLNEAVNSPSRDENLALEIVRGFTPSDAPPPAAAGPAPGRARGGAPASVAASVKRGADTARKLPYSKFEQATEMMSSGRMDPAKYQKIADAYMDAHEAGLVDYAA